MKQGFSHHRDAFSGKLSATAKKLASDNRGSAGIIFGLAIIPMFLVFGSALEYGMALRTKTLTQQALDAAALAATKAAATAAAAVVSSASCATPAAAFDPIALDGGTTYPYGKSGAPGATTMCSPSINLAAVNAASKVLAGYSNLVSKTNITPSISVSSSTGSWKINVSYTAAIPTSMMSIVGIGAIKMKGASTAEFAQTLQSYVNVHLLLDNSASQGIGATATDISNMTNLTGCAFGCHSPDASTDYYDTPKAQGIRFRIDDVRTAASSLVTLAQKISNNNIGMAVYTFDNSQTVLQTMTTNLATVATAVKNVDLSTSADGTQIGDALSWLSSTKIMGNGTGKSASSPIELAVLVTDGVEDGIYTGWNKPFGTTGVGLPWWGSLGGKPAPTGTVDPAYCDALKHQGVIVAIVYTTYVPESTDIQYTKLVAPFAANIPTNLQSCASPGYFFTASNSADITNGMQLLFNKAVNSTVLHLTN